MQVTIKQNSSVHIKPDGIDDSLHDFVLPNRDDFSAGVRGLSEHCYLFAHGNDVCFEVVTTPFLEEFMNKNPSMRLIGRVKEIVQEVSSNGKC